MERLFDWAIGLLPVLGAGTVAVVVAAVVLERRRTVRGELRGRRWLLDAVLLLSLLVIFVVTLAPVPVDEPSEWIRWNLIPFADFIRSLGQSPADVLGETANLAANVALFVPLGFAAGLRYRGLDLRRAVLAAALLSGAIELTQLFEGMGRESDVTDVLTNTLGAGLGFAAARLLRPTRPA